MSRQLQDEQERVARLDRRIAADVQGFGGYLRCESCGSHAPLGDVGDKLANGWPKCCGYTMRWWTRRQIENGEVPSLDPPNQSMKDS